MTDKECTGSCKVELEENNANKIYSTYQLLFNYETNIYISSLGSEEDLRPILSSLPWECKFHFEFVIRNKTSISYVHLECELFSTCDFRISLYSWKQPTNLRICESMMCCLVTYDLFRKARLAIHIRRNSANSMQERIDCVNDLKNYPNPALKLLHLAVIYFEAEFTSCWKINWKRFIKCETSTRGRH